MFSPNQSWILQRSTPSLVWIFAVTLLTWISCEQRAIAEDRIWSALLLASNVETPKKPMPEVARFSGAVNKVFGYNQVELIGSATQTIDEQCERWLVPTRNFWFGLKAKKIQDDDYLLDVTLFHDKRQLVEAHVKLGPSSPLFIRGPMHARGQLLIVLQVLQ